MTGGWNKTLFFILVNTLHLYIIPELCKLNHSTAIKGRYPYEGVVCSPFHVGRIHRLWPNT
jgi:hypothetical protein